MRTLGVLLIVLLALVGLGVWSAWALVDVLHDAVIQVDGQTVEVGQIGVGGLVIAGMALAAAFLIVMLVMLLALPFTVIATAVAVTFAAGVAVVAVLGVAGMLLWPFALIGLLVWWLARRSRSRSSGASHPAA